MVLRLASSLLPACAPPWDGLPVAPHQSAMNTLNNQEFQVGGTYLCTLGYTCPQQSSCNPLCAGVCARVPATTRSSICPANPHFDLNCFFSAPGPMHTQPPRPAATEPSSSLASQGRTLRVNEAQSREGGGGGGGYGGGGGGRGGGEFQPRRLRYGAASKPTARGKTVAPQPKENVDRHVNDCQR
jgi:hypothetical protein